MPDECDVAADVALCRVGLSSIFARIAMLLRQTALHLRRLRQLMTGYNVSRVYGLGAVAYSSLLRCHITHRDIDDATTPYLYDYSHDATTPLYRPSSTSCSSLNIFMRKEISR